MSLFSVVATSYEITKEFDKNDSTFTIVERVKATKIALKHFELSQAATNRELSRNLALLDILAERKHKFELKAARLKRKYRAATTLERRIDLVNKINKNIDNLNLIAEVI